MEEKLRVPLFQETLIVEQFVRQIEEASLEEAGALLPLTEIRML